MNHSNVHPAKIERIVFFGTPAFAVPTLDALAAAGRSPGLVVSQPTRAVGRGRRSQAPPVARWAEEHGVRLIQTERVKDQAFLETLHELGPCVAVVVAFGQIFRQPLLELPRLGCINVHASLLPAYRGASPITAAIQNGDQLTGVSTMLMERGLDSGPILLQDQLQIGANETAGELTPRVSELGAQLLVTTLDRLEAGTLQAREQDHTNATLAPMLKREDGDIDWTASAASVHNLVRAFDPWPGTRALFRQEVVAIKRTILGAEASDSAHQGQQPGTVVAIDAGAVWVVAGDHQLVGLQSVQRPGRRALPARDFVNGERVQVGERFASAADPSTTQA